MIEYLNPEDYIVNELLRFLESTQGSAYGIQWNITPLGPFFVIHAQEPAVKRPIPITDREIELFKKNLDHT